MGLSRFSWADIDLQCTGRNQPRCSRRAIPSGRAREAFIEPYRVRVEHVFGAQTSDMGGTILKTIGLVRAKAKIGMKNLAYNIRRSGQLRRLNPFPV